MSGCIHLEDIFQLQVVYLVAPTRLAALNDSRQIINLHLDVCSALDSTDSACPYDQARLAHDVIIVDADINRKTIAAAAAAAGTSSLNWRRSSSLSSYRRSATSERRADVVVTDICLRALPVPRQFTRGRSSSAAAEQSTPRYAIAPAACQSVHSISADRINRRKITPNRRKCSYRQRATTNYLPVATGSHKNKTSTCVNSRNTTRQECMKNWCHVTTAVTSKPHLK